MRLQENLNLFFVERKNCSCYECSLELCFLSARCVSHLLQAVGLDALSSTSASCDGDGNGDSDSSSNFGADGDLSRRVRGGSSRPPRAQSTSRDCEDGVVASDGMVHQLALSPSLVVVFSIIDIFVKRETGVLVEDAELQLQAGVSSAFFWLGILAVYSVLSKLGVFFTR